MSKLNYSTISKPFVIAAVVLSFVGVSVGSLWMFSLFGFTIQHGSNLFQVHRVIQLDGFLTLLIMGVSYMIIPRFRNMPNPSSKFSMLSFFLVIGSITLELYARLMGINLSNYAVALKIAGIAIFATLNFYTIKHPPKLLKEADYFMIISFSMLIISNILGIMMQNVSLNQIQLWFVFPVFAIFGVKYKVLPSFLGFMRPRKYHTWLCITSAVCSCVVGIISLYLGTKTTSILFNILFIASATFFALSVFIYGGFDNKEIVKMMPPEKKARYRAILIHTRIGFAFLIAGFLCGILFYLKNEFIFYDLAIHYTAIGFIGLSIMLFLPLMLPPITAKTINFLKLGHLPLVLILLSLGLRTAGDFVLHTWQSSIAFVFAFSGVVVLGAMVAFVIRIHKSMEPQVEFKSKTRH